MICTGLKSSIVCVLTVERKHVDDDNKRGIESIPTLEFKKL